MQRRQLLGKLLGLARTTVIQIVEDIDSGANPDVEFVIRE